jgi:hypothetical protein
MQRYYRLHRRATPTARDRQISLEPPYSALHAGNADPKFGKGIALDDRNTKAIVGDPEVQPCSIHLDYHGYAGCSGMAVDIRQGLLHDPENGTLDWRGCIVHRIVDLAGELQARTLGKALNEVPHRRCQSIPVEARWKQQV